MANLLNASVPVIEPTEDAADAVFTLARNEVPARLTATGLGDSETITISAADGPEGATVTAISLGGTALTLADDDNMVVLTAPGPYKVAKSATSGAAGVFLAKG